MLFRSNKTIGVHELFGVDVSATPVAAAVKVNAPLTLAGNVSFTAVDDKTFQWSGSGELIAYMADEEQSDVTEVFMVLASELESSIRGSAPLVSGGDVLRFEWVL